MPSRPPKFPLLFFIASSTGTVCTWMRSSTTMFDMTDCSIRAKKQKKNSLIEALKMPFMLFSA